MMDVKVYKIPMAGSDDVVGLKKLIETGEIVPEEIVAVFR